MNIVDFDSKWLDQARQLIRENHLEERAMVSVLPEQRDIPPLEALADNGLGAAAEEDGKLLGFLSAYGPWQPVFCTPDTKGVFSPLHAHAVQRDNRMRIWQWLYQAAAEKWVKAGAVSHAITLYAHDERAKEALYLYGFGVRCMDLMRPMEGIGASASWQCRELPGDEQWRLDPLRWQLNDHLGNSPCFMFQPPWRLEAWMKGKREHPPRAFVAEMEGQIIAYAEADREGENYLSDEPGTMNICGAYCLPEYRGSGAVQGALEKMIAVFRQEGYQRLGVDCESFNPTALAFWGKYFQPYTYSVVRRIDENAIR